jgi:hypothetical protein
MMPLHIRFTMFDKPIFHIGEHIAFYSRLGGGLNIMGIDPLTNFQLVARARVRNEIERIYGPQEYSLFSPGMHAMATVGAEYFFLPRFALALEWGILADLYYVSKGEIKTKFTGAQFQKATAPAAITYFNLDFPFTLSLRIIV